MRNRACSTVEKRACSRRGTPRTRRARNLYPISGLSIGQSCPSTHKRLGDMWSIGQAPTNANRWPSTTQAQRETKTPRNSSSPILTSSAMNTVYLSICLSCQLMHRVPHFHHPHSLSSSSSNNHVAPRRKTVSVDTKREREREKRSIGQTPANTNRWPSTTQAQSETENPRNRSARRQQTPNAGHRPPKRRAR